MKSRRKKPLATRLVLQGEIFQALKSIVIDHDSNTKGVHSISPQVSEKLKSKHPSGQAANDDILLNITKDAPKQVIFEEISVELVQSVTTNIQGSGGPIKVDSDFFKHIICSKFYGKNSIGLCQSNARSL